MKPHIIALAWAALLAATDPVGAQTPTEGAAVATPQQRALAAGYVALTLCSAIFNAEAIGGERNPRNNDHVGANELTGVYPELDTLVQELVPTSDTRAHHVAISWNPTAPPRIAVSRMDDGCTLLPPGATLQTDDGRFMVTTFEGVSPYAHPWPIGDEDAFAAVPASADISFLDVTVRNALEAGYGDRTNTTAVIVVHDDRIVRERYADGFGIHIPQRTWSVAKSIAATIVGAAVHRGEVDVNVPAAIVNWQDENDPRRAITLDHLLHMSSGLTSDSAGNRTDAIYFGGTAVDEQAPGWPLIAAPGTTFRYANNDTLLATLAIAPTFTAHPPGRFFASVDMNATIAETDWRGNYILSSQVWATARDLARFGMLYLDDGVWNGTRILPENWRTYVSTPSGPQPPGDFGYGASFWLMNRSAGVPADTIAAFGNRGQYVVIVPSRNIVIVRRGEDPHGARFDIAAFTRDVLAALE